MAGARCIIFEHSALLAGTGCIIFAFYQPCVKTCQEYHLVGGRNTLHYWKKTTNEFSSFLFFYLLTALLAQKHLDLLTNKKGKLQRRGPQSSSKWLTTSPRKSLREVEVHQNINLILYNNHLTNYQPSCSNYH